MALGIAYDPDEWPHGLRCIQCGRLFSAGDRYSERLEGIIPGVGDPGEDWRSQPTALVHIVCVGCALAGEDAGVV